MSPKNSITNAALALTSIEAPRLQLVLQPTAPTTTPLYRSHQGAPKPKLPAAPTRTKPEPPDALWDARAVAEFLGASASYVYKKVQAGKMALLSFPWVGVTREGAVPRGEAELGGRSKR